MKFNKSGTKENNSIKFSDEEDDELDCKASAQLGFYKKTQQAELIEVPIDEDIKGPAYYRAVTQAIRDSSEGDIIRFNICSPGGRLDGLMSLLSAMWKTDAITEAHIDGFADSAASMLAMHCDAVYVSPVASMLVHNTTYGIGGKAADIKAHVDHFNNFSEKFFRETYDLFLNEEEIEKCLNGYQLYLDAESIMQRLKHKFEVLQERQAAEQEEELLELEEQLEEAKKNSRKKTRQVH